MFPNLLSINYITFYAKNICLFSFGILKKSVFLPCQNDSSNEQTKKNKIMKKAITSISIIFLVAWCFFVSSIATVSYNVIELITVCIIELVLLCVPVLAITIITNIEY